MNRSELEHGAVRPARDQLDRALVRVLDPIFSSILRRWLLATSLFIALFVGIAVLAPVLAWLGHTAAASAIYDFYRGACHQLPFRSVFLFGPQVLYSAAEVQAQGGDVSRWLGSAEAGWKIALCQRDLAIFGGLLVFGALYGWRWRPLGLLSSGFVVFALLSIPMALDGFSQLPGWRESTWLLRLSTGALFGLACGWLLYPRFQHAFARSLA